MPATRFPFPWNSGNNSPQYTTTSGVLTDVTDNRWFVVFVYDFPDYVNGRAIKIVTAPQDFTTYALAVAYQWESIQSAYATMRDKEIRPLYKDIYYCDKSGGGAYPAGCKYAAKCSTTDIRTLKPSVISAAGGATLGSNVIVTAPYGYASTDIQSAYTELAANTIKGVTDVHTTPIDADSLGIWDSVGSVFKRISLLAIYNFFVSKSAAAAEATTLLDTDVMIGARSTDTKYWTWSFIKSQFSAAIATYNVNTYAGFRAVLESATTPASVVINLTSDITSDGLELLTKPTNIIVRGGRIILPISSNLWFSPVANSLTYKILVESTITAHDAGASIKVGSSTYSATVDVRVNAIVGLSTLAPVAISFIKVGSSTITASYNSLFNVEILGNVALEPTQENTFSVWLPEYVVQRTVTIGATYDGPYTIALVPLGYYVDKIDMFNTSAAAIDVLIEQGTVMSQSSLVLLHAEPYAINLRIRFMNAVLGEDESVYYNSFTRQAVSLNEPELLLAKEYSTGLWLNSTVKFRTTLKKYI
jgi:hypothetical protein